MNTESYRFKIGTFECIAVADGAPVYSVDGLFINTPEEQLERLFHKYDLQPEQVAVPYICLVIKAGDQRVLVDTGLGSGAKPDAGRLLQNMQAEGIAPEDIDLVIITHGHGDHIGGNAYSEGKPTFPNARYVMWQDEWDFWTSESNLVQTGRQGMIPFVRAQLLSIQNQFDLIDRETEILPGIRLVPATGHTPGLMLVHISSGDERLLYVSDVLLHPINLEQPDWYSVFDLAPEQAVAARRQVLDQAANEGALVFAFHFPFPGLGYVVQEGESWRWQPITRE